MNVSKHGLWRWIGVVLALTVAVTLVGTALAAEFVGEDNVYRLPAGEVVTDDLYVGAEQIYIDGTVEGDLVAFGGYIEINGTVTGDVLAMGAGIQIQGQVGDDVRAAGAGIDVTGTVGDDLFLAGGGNPGGFNWPIQINNISVQQGVRVHEGAQVGGDAVIVGGAGLVAGEIGEDLYSAMGQLTLRAQVGGNAEINAGQLQIDEASRIQGTLKYSTAEELSLPENIARRIQFEKAVKEVQRVSPVITFLWWVLRTVLMILGFAVLGWLLLRFAPDLLTRPAEAIQANPVETGLYGLLVAVLLLFIPVGTGILVAAVWLFWGVFPAILVGMTILAVLGVVWLFSPLITGLWLGQLIGERMGMAARPVAALIMGALLLVILGRIPCLGWLISFLSFILALGGMVQARRSAGSEGGPSLPAPGAALPAE